MRVFYSTLPEPCPYLPDRIERRIVTRLDGPRPGELYGELNAAGFRRSHGFAYRPACPGCDACVPVRIPAASFRWSRGFRRVLKANGDLATVEHPGGPATDEHYALFRRYLCSRHGDGTMAEMTPDDFRRMVEDSPVDTRLVEFRDGSGRLVAVSLTDRLADGLSGVYKFFVPEEPERSAGTYVVLWHVRRALELGLPYVYLGYWISGSRKMAYKARFRPLEALTPDGWRLLEEG
jgi:leucyl-tRNA---protein transferase